MNNTKKLTAIALAAVMAVSASGCADQSWSYKTDDVSLTTGTYIYNLLNGYYEADALIESPDEVDDHLKAEVKGSDSDEVKTVEQLLAKLLHKNFLLSYRGIKILSYYYNTFFYV